MKLKLFESETSTSILNSEFFRGHFTDEDYKTNYCKIDLRKSNLTYQDAIAIISSYHDDRSRNPIDYCFIESVDGSDVVYGAIKYPNDIYTIFSGFTDLDDVNRIEPYTEEISADTLIFELEGLGYSFL